jgi:hypothetical protein
LSCGSWLVRVPREGWGGWGSTLAPYSLQKMAKFPKWGLCSHFYSELPRRGSQHWGLVSITGLVSLSPPWHWCPVDLTRAGGSLLAPCLFPLCPVFTLKATQQWQQDLPGTPRAPSTFPELCHQQCSPKLARNSTGHISRVLKGFASLPVQTSDLWPHLATQDPVKCSVCDANKCLKMRADHQWGWGKVRPARV